MKTEEVKAPSNEELRTKAAELMGWRPHFTQPSGCMCGWEDPDGNLWPWESAPDYPHDIAAAWELQQSANGVRFAYALAWVLGVTMEAGCPKWDTEELMRYCYADARDRTRAFILAMTQGGGDPG